MRLDKFLSDATAYSRREIKSLVRKGCVRVNDKNVSACDIRVADNDCVAVNGVRVSYRKYIYLMLNKPQGYLSATEDKRDPVVVDLVPEELQHFKVFPVGRLDKDTEGLLLLTNDGNFDHHLMSPRKNVFKRYYARLDIPAEDADIAIFSAGMELDDFVAKPAKLEICADPCEVFIEIAEGKFHQVKRMCANVGKNVTFLRRVAIGGVKLDETLPAGGVRELTAEELQILGYST